MKKSLIYLTALGVFPILLASCGLDSTVVEKEDKTGVTGIFLSATEISVARGGTYQLEANVTVSQETVDRSVTWSTNNPSIATVSEDGLITALSLGECKISATSVAGARSAYCKVNVVGSEGPTTVTSLTLDVSSYVFEDLEKTLEINATVSPETYSSSVIWSSNNDDVATVVGSGRTATVTPIGYGTTAIVASCGTKTATCSITVKKPEDPQEFKIILDKTKVAIDVNETVIINATTVNPSKEPVTFTIDKETIVEKVAKTDNQIELKGLTSGTAILSASANGKTATCEITVKKDSSEYEQWLASFSKTGHIYFHYLRTSDSNYDPWALWVWQKVPEDSEGTLWGATHAEELKTKANITSQSTAWMTNKDVGGVEGKKGDDAFIDPNGQIVDIDTTRGWMDGGKTGAKTRLDNEDPNNPVTRIGFLIVDQTKMTGGSHWTSDGGIEAYVRKFNDLMSKTGYLHIFCIEGQVTQFTTSSGQKIDPNPTATDTTGNYRSKNDIENLKRDLYPNGVPTSESFLEDRPGVGYQIFVPSFADSNGDGLGDLRGIIKKIDDNYFTNLGVGVLWLTPIQESGSYHGYDVTDYYKIDPKFGTLDDYQELIYKAHKKGIKVLMDMVINHTSKNNVLFTKSQRAEKEVINGKEINYRDMYLWKFKGDKVRQWDGTVVQAPTTPTYNNVNVEETSDWYRDGSSNYYYYGKFGSGMAELNYSCQATRDYMTDMCKYWLSFGLDGFRLDAIKHIYLASEIAPEDVAKYKGDYVSGDVSYRTYYDDEMKQEVTVPNDYTYDRDLNVKFWKEFAGTIKASYPNCFLVGENYDGWNERIAPFYEAIDSQFDFSTYYHLHELGANAIASDVQKTLNTCNKAYRQDHINGAFTSNHDLARMMNHAAVPFGDNTTQHAEVNASNLAAATNQAHFNAAMTLLTPGVSWIYYGDELGMTGNLKDAIPGEADDHGNNKDRWYRQPMKWGNNIGQDMVPNYGFGGLRVNWDNMNAILATANEQAQDDNSMLSYFRSIGKVKSDSRYPTYGYIEWAGQIGSETNSCCFQISDGTRIVNVFINNTDHVLDVEDHNKGIECIGGSKGATQLKVPAHGFTVNRVK